MQRKRLLLNDVHLGVQRSGGTTPTSAARLKGWLLQQLRDVMFEHLDKDIIFNGDIFDAFAVSMQDVLEFYFLCDLWLNRSEGGSITLGRGNHDIAKDSTKLSAFDFVGELLSRHWGNQVLTVTEPVMVAPGIFMIPHMPNQDLFNLAMERIPDEAKMVLVHANFDNRFAVERDHSLNVSREQAWKIITAADGPTEPVRRLIFGHEHQGKRDFAGRLHVTGNQWPTSVADCMGNPDGMKCAHIIHSPDSELEPITTWVSRDSFNVVQWQDLSTLPDNAPSNFVRVTGRATAAESPEVIKAIAQFRQRSEAFVITNSVVVEGMKDITALTETAEEIKAFDVLKFLFEQLDPEQSTAVKALVDEHGIE